MFTKNVSVKGVENLQPFNEQILQQVLKGEHIAVYSYEKAIEKLKDTKIRQRLVSFQTEHKQWARLLKEKWDLGQENESGLSIWSQTMVSGMFLFDHLASQQEDTEFMIRIRDGEEMEIKELKKCKEHIQNKDIQDLLERMITQAVRRVRELNRHVDQLRTQ